MLIFWQGCTSLELGLPRVNSAYTIDLSFTQAEFIGILFLRTWAVWGQSKWVGVGLFTLYVAVGTVICYVMTEFLGSMECELDNPAYELNIWLSFTLCLQVAPIERGCTFLGGSNIESFGWVSLIVFETGERSSPPLVQILTSYNGPQSRWYWCLFGAIRPVSGLLHFRLLNAYANVKMRRASIPTSSMFYMSMVSQGVMRTRRDPLKVPCRLSLLCLSLRFVAFIKCTRRRLQH